MRPKTVRILKTVRIQTLTRVMNPHQKRGKIVLKKPPVRVVRVVRVLSRPSRVPHL
jgi:hypothetical protein